MSRILIQFGSHWRLQSLKAFAFKASECTEPSNTKEERASAFPDLVLFGLETGYLNRFHTVFTCKLFGFEQVNLSLVSRSRTGGSRSGTAP